ncbi:hypothetical protein BH10BAC6_BH10BAC6_05840 [soil metagenome]
MRTFEEIAADIHIALGSSDAPSLLRHAVELDDVGTLQARAFSYKSRGWASITVGEYAAAIEQFNQALPLFTEIADRSEVANIMRSIGAAYVGSNNYPSALEQLNGSLQLYGELGDRAGMALVTSTIGGVYLSTGDFPAALEQLNNALAMQQEVGNRGGVALATGYIGIVYANTSDFPTALERFNTALALYLELGNRSGVATLTGNIGAVCVTMGDYATALMQLQRALALHQELGDRGGVAEAISNIGGLYSSMGDYSAALEQFNIALALHKDLGNRTGEAIATNNILHAQIRTQDVELARQTLATLDDFIVDNPTLIVERETGRAKIHTLDGNLQAAQTTLLNALDVASAHGLRSAQVTVCQELRDLAQQRNDFAAYIEHNNEYTRINEEIRGADAKLKVAMQAKEREIAEKDKEHAKHIAILHSTLPKHIADRVARGEVVNDQYDNAAVLFLDIVGFTTLSSSMDASEVVMLLDRIFGICDVVMNAHGLMKIKTIGDSYMAVAFDTIENAAHAALELASAITEVPVRIGIHCGPVVAGVLGKERMQYDVWGDTVNIASRMESTGEAHRIHVSGAFAQSLHNLTKTFRLTERGNVQVKGKGTMQTFWLERA